MLKRIPAFRLAVVCALSVAFAQSAVAVPQTFVVEKPKAAVELTEAQRAEVVESIADILEKNYVFPDKGKAMADMLRGKLREKAYADLNTPERLKVRVIEDLQHLHHDSHMNLMFFPPDGGFAFVSKADADEAKVKELDHEAAAQGRKRSFGLTKLEILEGNIGYLRIDGFQAPAEAAKPSVAAAMKLLENADAVIIDLRGNPGGDPGYVALVASYFFDGPPVMLNRIYTRPTNTTVEYHTVKVADSLAGKRLYILTSSATGSGGEELAYDLQVFKKATIVGETTIGGAHQMSPYAIKSEAGTFVVLVPDGRVENAVTHTNWEGVGVKPDVPTASGKALTEAHRLALVETAEASGDAGIKERNARIAAKLGAEQANPAHVANPAELGQYVGKYGEREVTLEGDTLKFQRVGGPKLSLAPVGDGVFEIDIPGPEKPRVVFKKEGGAVTGFTLERPGGSAEFIAREE